MKGQLGWLRVFVEGVVIVVSILMAFGIEAGWEGWRELQQERGVLSAFVRELRNNAEHLERFSTLQQQQLDRVVVLLDATASDDPDISADSLDHLLAGLAGATVPVYERGALDAALRRADVISNFSVRQRLSEWERALDQLGEFEDAEASLVRELWMPIMRAQAYLPQVSNVGRAKIEGWNPREIRTRGSEDHLDLLRSRELVNVLVQRQWVHEDVLREQVSVQAFLRGLLLQLRGY